MRNIEDLPTRSETHVAYSDDEMKQLFDYMLENDEYLLFFCKFVAYVFLRPNEALSLQVKHFDLTNKRITLTAENAKVNTRTAKLIPQIFINDIISRNITSYPKEYYIFGLGGKPQPDPVNRRYFAAHFKRVKKILGFSKLHTLYGFRHTTVSQLIRNKKNWDDIMKLTGHTSMTSFQKYARSLMAIPAEDLSDGFAVM